jgi:coenzyme F420-reducing hydrogenase delta subunit
MVMDAIRYNQQIRIIRGGCSCQKVVATVASSGRFLCLEARGPLKSIVWVLAAPKNGCPMYLQVQVQIQVQVQVRATRVLCQSTVSLPSLGAANLQ